MSIDIDWESATGGPDGEALAERIRAFVHDKFQNMPLPGFIRSVDVTSFGFGTVAPDFEILNLSDPFEDFYEEDGDTDDEDGDDNDEQDEEEAWDEHGRDKSFRPHSACGTAPETRVRSRRASERSLSEDNNSVDPLFSWRRGFIPSRPSTSPGIGSPSLNLYPPIQLGDHFILPHHEPAHIPGASGVGIHNMSVASNSLATSGAGPSFPRSSIASSQGVSHDWSGASAENQSMNDTSDNESLSTCQNHQRHMHERKAEDLQIFCRVRYSGNVRLSLTAVILLDYPMPSFVGLPLKLNISGMTFDGVAVLAYIRKRVHLCFLSPEDEGAFLPMNFNKDSHSDEQAEKQQYQSSSAVNQKDTSSSVLRKIRVESEIGRKENGKQVLKNVGKVEKFVLEQVRRIFDEELVYPSFWTFLV